jgi:membrane protein
VTFVTYGIASLIHVPPGAKPGCDMAQGKTGVVGLVKQTVRDFLADDCMDSAAALSYYTIFSLPAILVLLLTIIGAVMNPSDVRGGIENQLQALMGPSAGQQIRTIIQQAQEKPDNGTLPTLLGIAGLLFGATGALGQLQKSLNRTWNVEPDPNQGGLKSFLSKRLFSLGMLLVLAFFLLVSLVISAAISGIGDRLSGFLPSGFSAPLLEVLNALVSLAVVTLLFAAMFKVMPDARISWRSVWVGAAVTALLFGIGKFLIGFYLGQSNPGRAYGAAGSLAVLLLWVYYSALILLFGAEFTESWAEERGHGIEPEPGAVRVRREKHRVAELGPSAHTSR